MDETASQTPKRPGLRDAVRRWKEGQAAQPQPAEVATAQKPVAKPAKAQKPRAPSPAGCEECARLRKQIALEQGARAEANRKRGKGVRRRAEGNGRLPDRAEFVVSYDAASETWSGVLVLADGTQYAGQAGGVEKLLRSLAAQFRAAQAPAAEGEVAP